MNTDLKTSAKVLPTCSRQKKIQCLRRPLPTFCRQHVVLQRSHLELGNTLVFYLSSRIGFVIEMKGMVLYMPPPGVLIFGTRKEPAWNPSKFLNSCRFSVEIKNKHNNL
jgi:hypothetical protein